MSVAVYHYADGSEHVIVRCDHHACTEDHVGFSADYTNAASVAAAELDGWTVLGTNHYCPEHRP